MSLEATASTGVQVAKVPEVKIKPVYEPTFTSCMEQLQDGYVSAVAATAGCTVQPVARDVFGMDLLIVRPRPPGEQELSFYVQLKNTTTIAPDLSKESFSFQFKHRSHLERLAAPRDTVKAILVVMVTDPDQSQWTSADHDRLSIVKSCYWANLEGHQIADGVASPSVRVPTANRFDAPAIEGILKRLDAGEPL